MKKKLLLFAMLFFNATAYAVNLEMIDEILSQEACACRCGNSTSQCLKVHTSCQVSRNRFNYVYSAIMAQQQQAQQWQGYPQQDQYQAPQISGPAAGTIGTINRMMHDALHGDAEEIERKYHGINSLNEGAATQNRIYNEVYQNQLRNNR
ncbi:hypothetical protein [Methylobacter sp. sgz302048]|uniref:hypothetical protein n=1 Tax=Methylobacter sp. sgz302048 TaxID=3455945 RepID=UPI003F9EF782